MLFVILCTWLSQVAPAAEQPPELLLLSRWVYSVERHEVGKADVEASVIAVWSSADLQRTVDTMRSLRDALQRAARAEGAARERQAIRTRSGYPMSVLQAQTLLGLSDDEAQRGDVNRLLKRGAMLHADIGMLAQEGLVRAAGPSVAGTPPSGRTVLVSDGRIRGPDDRDRHWLMASWLLDAVTPEPGQDDWVHRWYRAAASRTRRDSELASAAPLLDRAKQLFPGDALFPFHVGCLHETLASPAVQAVVASEAPPRGASTTVFRPGTNWAQAASAFNAALALQPEWPEARLRLGRVLGLLGRHQEAVAMLGRVLRETTDPPLVYWGSLFLGAEQVSLGRDAEARASFARARALRPAAQAPSLALSQLARQSGDRAQAVAELRAVLTLPSDEVTRYDPMWDYRAPRTSEADTLFAELRRELGAGRTPDAGAIR
jgi:tetratricopeptide (TPR) repeat protein